MATVDPYARLQRVARRGEPAGLFHVGASDEGGPDPVQLHRLVKRGSVERAARNVYRFTVSARRLGRTGSRSSCSQPGASRAG